MIKLSQKRTCEGCKALIQPVWSRYIFICSLGYSFDEKYKPLEVCPKPKTIADLIECNKYYKKL